MDIAAQGGDLHVHALLRHLIVQADGGQQGIGVGVLSVLKAQPDGCLEILLPADEGTV